jgi:tRNA threonylcarbamoyladenosine biosynthesis protein TsaB
MRPSREAAAILGIDTATADVAVAVARTDGVIWEGREPPSERGRPRHAETLLPAVEEAVEAAGGWDAIAIIGLGIGPGTFTGLRVGIATGRALAQARGLEIAPVTSLAALARGIADRHRRPGLALIDARRDEMFAGLYGADDEPIWEPFVAAPEAIGERAAGLAPPPRAAGDGSLRFRHRLEAAGVEVLPDTDRAHRMAARHVCALAERAPRMRPEQVTPIYLRRPDAEVWREQRADQPAPRG